MRMAPEIPSVLYLQNFSFLWSGHNLLTFHCVPMTECPVISEETRQQVLCVCMKCACPVFLIGKAVSGFDYL